MNSLDAILLRRADEQVRHLSERLESEPVQPDSERRQRLPAILEYLGAYRHGRTFKEVLEHLTAQGHRATLESVQQAIYRAQRRGEAVRVLGEDGEGHGKNRRGYEARYTVARRP